MLMPVVFMSTETLQIKGEGVEEGAYSGVDKEGEVRECERVRVRMWVETQTGRGLYFLSF